MAIWTGTRSPAATVDHPTVSTSRARRRGGVFIIFLAISLMAGLVVVATRADGREISRTTANDGGAWLVNRDLSTVAHRNYASGELSSHIRVTDSPTADVFQSGDLVVVHDAATNQLFEVDTRSFIEDFEPTQLPEFTTVLATNNALVVTRNEPLAVWRIEQGQLAGVSTLDDVEPLVATDGRGRATASADGRIAVLDSQSRSLIWIDAQGVVSDPIELAVGEDEVIDLTIVEATAVALTSTGDLFVVGATSVEQVVRWADQSVSGDQPVLLQQPSVSINSYGIEPARSVALVTGGGELIEVTLMADDPQIRNLGSIPGGSPVAPIAFEGCVYGLTTNPPNFGVSCDDFSSQVLVGAGPNLRLRLVNGWVLVNDLDSGTAFATDENLNFQQFDDWGPAQEIVEEDEVDDTAADSTLSDADGPLEDDPDAEGSVQDSDDFNPGEANVAPVAVDDIARTRVDRSVVVDVLANDRDANNDILVVTDVELVNGVGVVTLTPSGSAVQVTPGAGFSGTIGLRYFMSDGKSEPVSAFVTIEVVPLERTNRPPVAVTDVIATAPGHTTTVDVLLNDSDPDGDAIALGGVETTTGTLRWDPIGQVTFTPDITTTAGWLELPYIVLDDLGAESEGLLRVEIRDDGANQEPDARNDQAITVVGRTVVINVLANDSDPDGDPLIVGSQPRLLEPLGATPTWQTTSDGEFVFRSDVAGTFLFSYTANDAAATGGESDTARIRVDVRPATGNQPPVAVRDDVVIATGETRTVNALENDGDPDGDLVSIVDWQHSDGIDVVEYNDGTGVVGFQITVQPGAVTRPTMSYTISDGFNAPVSAPIVVAVVQRTAVDQPPFANDDVIEARAGSTLTGIKVLNNDFDPEGGALRVVRIGDSPTAETAIAEDEQAVDLVIAEDAVSSFSIPYDIEDLAGNRAAAVLRVQLINPNAANRPPVARTDEARTNQGEPVLINVLANDSDPDSDIILLEAISSQPSNGTAELADGVIRYAPDLGFSGTDSFQYAIVDSQGDRAIGDVFIGVREDPEANRRPIANDDSFVLAGVPSTTPLDVLQNDSDPDNDPLRVTRVTSPSEGSVEVDGFSRVLYQPPLRLAEDTIVTFDYWIVDTAQNSDQATVSIQLSAFEERELEEPLVPEATPTPDPTPAPTPEVTPTPTPTPPADDRTNEAPIAVNDQVGPVTAGTRVEVAVLDNDRDPDGEPGGLAIIEVGSGGQQSGDIVVVEVDDETVVISYVIEDVDGATATANITVLVIANQGPTIAPLDVTTPFETAIDLEIAGQAVDPDGDPLFFVCCESIRGGTIANVVTSADTFRLQFTPDPDFFGPAGFSYVADDQQGHPTAGSVSIQVLDPGNRVPETIADTVSIPQGETVQVDLAALTSDPDDDTLVYSLVSEPGDGISVQITGTTAAVSVDRDKATGSADQFTYQVTDGELSAVGTVSIEISEGANRPPTASDFSRDVPAAGSATIDLASLTIEPDPGDSVTFELQPDTSGAQTVATLSGSIMQIQPPAQAVGEVVSYTYTATDTRGSAASGVITVTVAEPTSPEPAATNDTATTDRNTVVVVDVLSNDADPLGQGLTLDEVQAPWGTATVIGNELRFDPGDEVGTVRVDYTLSDQANRPASGRATIEVVGAPDQPAPPGVTRGSEQVDITWVEPAGNGRAVEGYRIFSSEHVDPQVVGRQNSFTWTGLTNSVEHTFWVVAFNEVGDSIQSDPSPVVTPDQVPEAPSPAAVTRGDGELTITWDEATSFGTEVDRYEVAISPSTGRPPQTVSSGLELTWEGLDNGSNYTFTVRAHNDAGWSESSAMSPEGRPSAPPDQPVIGATTRGTQSAALTVNWSDGALNGAPILEYEVRSSAIPDPVSVIPTDLSYAWSELPNGVDMTFAVRGRNEAGWSPWSAESNSMQACGAPDAPTNVVAVRGDTEADVTWTGPSNTETCQVTNYIVEALLDGAVAHTRNTSSTSRNFPGLTNGLDYSFRVRATNSIGTGAQSVESPQVRPAGPPICRTSVNSFTSSVDAPRAVNLAWSNLALENGEPILDYQIDQGRGAGYESLGSIVESTTFNAGLTNDTTYNYDIQAVNVVGVSGPCLSTSATTWALPTAVTATGEFDAETEDLTMTVSGGDSNGVPGATRTIGLTLDGSVVIEPPTDISSQNTRVYPITTDGSYVADLEACNAAGCVQGQSVPLDIVLAAPPAQMTTANLQIGALANTNVYITDPGLRISASISPPADNGSPILQYTTDVEWGGSSGNWHSVATIVSDVSNDPGASFTIDEAYIWLGYSSHSNSTNYGNTYTFRIRSRASNLKGEGDWSDWVSVSPTPPAPTIDFTVVQSWDCTPSEQPDNFKQCFQIQVEMYGFRPDHDYFFQSQDYPGVTTRMEHQGGITNAEGTDLWQFSCNIASPTTDSAGLVPGTSNLCVSPLHSSFRLVSNDGYNSPWTPGVP